MGEVSFFLLKNKNFVKFIIEFKTFIKKLAFILFLKNLGKVARNKYIMMYDPTSIKFYKIKGING